jgi:hypothetical protein
VHAPVALEMSERSHLVGRQRDDLALAIGDLASKQAAQLDRRRQQLVEQPDGLGAGRPTVGRLTGPAVERAVDGAPGRPRVAVGQLPIEDEVRLDVRMSSRLGPGAAEVDVWEGDRVAGDRVNSADVR